MPSKEIKIEQSWKDALAEEFTKPYFAQLTSTLKERIRTGVRVYPAGSQIFAAFAKTPFTSVKVLILGQDPYHNPGEAMGLSFSVPRGVQVPPSLRNIYKELQTDLDVRPVTHGDLSSWAEQGVLLLNAMLTVEHRSPKSHHKLGWQTFTDAVIKTLSERREGIVFLLWGAFAQKKAELIDHSKHLVLTAAHPSPLARGAFFGSRPFSQTNEYLKARGKDPIQWQLPD